VDSHTRSALRLASTLVAIAILASSITLSPKASAALTLCPGSGNVTFLGDSFTQGTPQGGGQAGSWIWQLGRRCGYQNVVNDGRGSTGAIVTSDTSANYVTRATTDVAPTNPDIVFITGYYNDRGHPPADIAAAFGTTIDIVAQLPTHPMIVVTGTYDPKGLNGSPYRQIDAGLLAVCTQRGVPFVEPSTGNVYDSAGRVVTSAGPWITPDNKEHYVGPDGVHQSVDGQAYMADRMFDAVRALSG
jgi:lysophospholipase L1-like esterase